MKIQSDSYAAGIIIISGLKDDFVKNVDDWKNFHDQTDIENSKFPVHWYDKSSDFQRILIVRAIRPDKVIPVITKLIATELGENFIHPPPFDVQQSYGDSNCLSPLVFILSPGVDPMASLLQFADKMGQVKTLRSVSLGQGQVNNEFTWFNKNNAIIIIIDVYKQLGSHSRSTDSRSAENRHMGLFAKLSFSHFVDGTAGRDLRFVRRIHRQQRVQIVADQLSVGQGIVTWKTVYFSSARVQLYTKKKKKLN